MSDSRNDVQPQNSTVVMRVNAWLNRPVDASGLAFFRMAFGAVVLWHAYTFCSNGWAETSYSPDRYHLTYPGFSWVTPLPGNGMKWVFYAMGMSAAGVILGMCYRVCAVVLFVTFTYTFLVEASFFQNHYYLTCLVAFWLCVAPAHRSFSLDALHSDKPGLVPAWCHWVILFHVAVPYTFGGIAKLNYDWLHSKPVGIWMALRSDLPLIGPYLTEPSSAQFVSWFGVVFDLAVVPLLLWKRTRAFAFVLALGFHFCNSILFSIDYFPWFMMAATTIFFEPNWFRKLLCRPIKPFVEKGDIFGPSVVRSRIGAVLMVAYISWQIAFPFRHLLYPGDPSWTEEGQEFAWRMMLRQKSVWIRFYGTEKVSGDTIEFPIEQFLTAKQIHGVAVSPFQIAKVAHYLAAESRKIGVENVEIRTVALVSLNGRKPQLLIAPELDLLTVKSTLGHQPWVLPLTEPLVEEVWDMDSALWPEALDVSLPVTVQTAPAARKIR